jgi:hypothetical protein
VTAPNGDKRSIGSETHEELVNDIIVVRRDEHPTSRESILGGTPAWQVRVSSHAVHS